MNHSPDGDFLFPDSTSRDLNGPVETGHSPLTGIFCFRITKLGFCIRTMVQSHSPLTGIFCFRICFLLLFCFWQVGSQSPDGDFLFPDKGLGSRVFLSTGRHSPLTGIFCFRMGAFAIYSVVANWSQSPDGDFLFPDVETPWWGLYEYMSQSPVLKITLKRRRGVRVWLCNRVC
jgi:hypothetical protein